jgi:hypothetical protein
VGRAGPGEGAAAAGPDDRTAVAGLAAGRGGRTGAVELEAEGNVRGRGRRRLPGG